MNRQLFPGTESSEFLTEDGLIFGSESSGLLSDAPIVRLRTRSGLILAAASHHGYGYKSVNEDRVAMVEVEGAAGGLDVALFVVDGMGGRERGDLAAQIVSEELIRSVLPPDDTFENEVSLMVKDRVEAVLWRLPGRDFVRNILSRWRSEWSENGKDSSPERLIRSALEAVNAESLHNGKADAARLRGVAEALRELGDMKVPNATEVALRRTQRRIVTRHPGPGMPDACFIGALIQTGDDGVRILDIRQIGDCRLFVVGDDDRIRFRTFGDSVIPEPDFSNPNLSLSDLMAYSLHRNLVRNSINSDQAALKQYRRQDVPMVLEAGDRIFLYSDGVDDLFTPEELVEMARDRAPGEFVRDLLVHSERRMRHVSGLLLAQRDRLAHSQLMKAYPLTHERLNRIRIEEGAYVENYRDGAVGRWTKPPKCDNLSMCIMTVE